jgi:hypothetical protein
MIKRIFIVTAMAGMILGGTSTMAHADQPGAGDSQCIPGQQGNPHPAHKAGVCSNP